MAHASDTVEAADEDARSPRSSFVASRWLGAACVLAGCVLLAFDGRWNPHLGSLPGPGDHGLYTLEVIGFALAAAGIVLLWTGDRRGSRTAR